MPEASNAIGRRLRLQHSTHGLVRAMKARLERPDGDPEHVRRLIGRQVEVVVRHEGGAMLDRQPSEAVLDLVPVEDGVELVVGRRGLGYASPNSMPRQRARRPSW